MWWRGERDRSVQVTLLGAAMLMVWWAWLVVRRISSGQGATATLVSILVASAFLVAGPAALLRWEHRRRHLVSKLGDRPSTRMLTDSLWARVMIVGVPVVLVPGAFLLSDRFALEVLGVDVWSLEWVLSLLTLVVGSTFAGQGIWAAWHSFEVGMRLAVARSESVILAPRADLNGSAVVEFSAESALLYGLASAVILPGMVITAREFPGVLRFVLVALILLMLATQIALVVGPAGRLARAEARIRFNHLDRIGHAISPDVEELLNGDAHDDATAAKLSAILEIREHLVAFPSQDPTVFLLSRSLYVIAFPVASMFSTWLSILG